MRIIAALRAILLAAHRDLIRSSAWAAEADQALYVGCPAISLVRFSRCSVLPLRTRCLCSLLLGYVFLLLTQGVPTARAPTLCLGGGRLQQKLLECLCHAGEALALAVYHIPVAQDGEILNVQYNQAAGLKLQRDSVE